MIMEMKSNKPLRPTTNHGAADLSVMWASRKAPENGDSLA